MFELSHLRFKSRFFDFFVHCNKCSDRHLQCPVWVIQEAMYRSRVAIVILLKGIQNSKLSPVRLLSTKAIIR
ncbi:unnamed protein product [Brugia pahangi]|uniref:Ovule protein n=1 Tax=Brugia pahangi TaxID=6280 RepID=A0A0N4SWM9_BRUPA|nr:unnamed protein product [Brugia pahangi]